MGEAAVGLPVAAIKALLSDTWASCRRKASAASPPAARTKDGSRSGYSDATSTLGDLGDETADRRNGDGSCALRTEAGTEEVVVG